MRYSSEFKEQMVKKLLLPGGPSGVALSQQTGIPQSTLSGWLSQYNKKSERGSMSQTKSPQEKLKILKETSSLNDEQLGAYLRKHGLHSEQLKDWESEILESLSLKNKVGRPKQSVELNQVKKKIKKLEKEIARKDKALAETAALLVLKKKLQDHFSDGEKE